MGPVKVAVFLGSESDLETMSPCFEVLREFGAPFGVYVASAHRCPNYLDAILKTKAAGAGVIIAAAGGAAHLPGVIASKVTVPVIGVPILTKALGGADSLYSIAQMPSGVPVAAVGINAAKNAGLLALEILSVSDGAISAALSDFRKKTEEALAEKSRAVEARFAN